jgi:hypothetical protein
MKDLDKDIKELIGKKKFYKNRDSKKFNYYSKLSKLKAKQLKTKMRDNKLIAEFMGLSIKEGVCYYTDADDMFPMGIEVKEPYIPYHTSWDWLMPVVVKIEHIESITHGNQFQVMICEEEVGIYDKHTQTQIVCIPTDGESKLTNTYKAVVEFIKN